MTGEAGTQRGAEPLVRFSGIRKSYDGRTVVVDNLDLDIARGEFLTLLGPSGSGKTTTLMMLAGFEVPTAGRILLGGHDITVLPPHRRGIGVVFQNYALFPHMTVAENIAYPLAVRGVSKADAAVQVRAALDMVKLGGFAERRPAQLSGGQQQRVALARALVFGPELVLLDEPLGALDKQLREQMQYELKQLHEKIGVTMVYVTHDQGEALTMSDRVAVFNDGRIQQLAPPTVLYERPANAFVAGFVGENNRLAGRVEAVSAGEVLVVVEGGFRIGARPVDPIAAGDAVVLSLRPEHVTVSAPDGAQSGIPAEIGRVVYLGDALRLVLTTAGGPDLIVKAATRGLPVDPERGRAVVATFRAEDCLAFAAPADPGGVRG